jgi:hypothetical protein
MPCQALRIIGYSWHVRFELLLLIGARFKRKEGCHPFYGKLVEVIWHGHVVWALMLVFINQRRNRVSEVKLWKLHDIDSCGISGMYLMFFIWLRRWLWYPMWIIPFHVWFGVSLWKTIFCVTYLSYVCWQNVFIGY